ncbi:hypothetical protein [Pedobacter arcticus]|uniref:hypothetical protein n=1 Tax=Pedobacter arcticus TaxID=752140 RepID=UPI0012B634B5|nr:hypothetical protein [Pedobacter arcticus]
MTVISDGHTTADRPSLTAKQVIAHYNWVWKEMTPARGQIEIITCNEYLEKSKNVL